MPGFTITNGVTFSSGFRFSADPEPITATAGPITSVSGSTGTAITSFFPFASVQNGVQPYTYFVSAGVLPTGITINSSTGLVSGTPTVAQGASNVTFTVRDSNNVLASTTSIVSFNVISLTYTIQYLVVAGGGGGGMAGGTIGQGGSGGGGGVVRGSIATPPGTPFTLSVGGGGLGGPAGASTPGSNGANSTISSPTVTTITAVGGGAGTWGGRCAQPGLYPFIGNPGGSGGGGPTAGGTTQSSQNPGNPTVIQQYGNAGGSNTPGSSSAGQGGGGAGGAGSLGPGGGGAGYTYPFTGNTYAAGGPASPTVWSTLSTGAPGGTGTGNGGVSGTGFPSSGAGGAGGSGTIILVLPTPSYPGSAPGAVVTTPPAAPGQTVLTYTPATPTSPQTFTYTA